METSYPQLTPEQRQAIADSGGLPVHVEDPDTHKLYVLVEHPQGVPLDDEYIRDELTKGIAALEAGERVPWDPERIKQEGRRRLAARKAQK
ncbi:MAG: hypothetical protein WD738_06675 [Pirellulales bacterium]